MIYNNIFKILKIYISYSFIFLSFNVYASFQSSVSLEEIFIKKQSDFWVIKNHEAYVYASNELVDEHGNWKGPSNYPSYIQYIDKFGENDIELLLKWLQLKNIRCFSLTDKDKCNALDTIYNWYKDKEEAGEDLQALGLYKLAWLDSKSTIEQLAEGEAADIPQEWLETNRLFHIKNSSSQLIFNELNYSSEKLNELLSIIKNEQNKPNPSSAQLKEFFLNAKLNELRFCALQPYEAYYNLANLHFNYAKTLEDNENKIEVLLEAQEYINSIPNDSNETPKIIELKLQIEDQIQKTT